MDKVNAVADQGLTVSDYRTVLDVQNACNLSGVVFAFADIMQRLCNEGFKNGYGTKWKNTHLTVQLLCDKLADLVKVPDYDAYNAALMLSHLCSTVYIAVENYIAKEAKDEKP